MILTNQEPKWLENYAPGYIGFQFTSDSLLSEGIAYFERWDRLSDIRVSHTFCVTGPYEVVEALSRGVVTSPLEERFKDPHCLVFFRKPRFYSLEMGCRIADAALSKVGCGYDFALIGGQLAANLWITQRLLSKSTRERVQEYLLSHTNNPDKFICSELDAYALDKQPELHDRGCLAKPDYWIVPQMLFEDNEVFENWKSQAV